MLSMLQATSSGTLFMYQGQEIGMANIPADWPVEEYKDISSQNYWKSVTKSTRDKRLIELAKNNLRAVARDHARTPMQWNDGLHAGFTTSKAGPWMRVNDDYRDINVQQQTEDPDSVLSFWKRMLVLRREHLDLFVAGTWRSLDRHNPSTMTYLKAFEDQKALVVLNFTKTPQTFVLPDEFLKVKPVVVNVESWESDVLGPYEGRGYVR
jgi:alpha-glucosidase